MTPSIHFYPIGRGISTSKKFAEKGLAEYAVNVGLKCGHGCTYCSTGASNRCSPAFKKLGISAYDTDYSIIDPAKPEKVAADAARIRRRGVVQLCTTVDAWEPAAQTYQLGRRCLEALLAQPNWTVRILTKNAAVADDFKIIKRHPDRVLVSLSLTGTPAKQEIIKVIEPNASSISERIAALKKAHRMALALRQCSVPCCRAFPTPTPTYSKWWNASASAGSKKFLPRRSIRRARTDSYRQCAGRTHGYVAEADAVTAVRRRRAHAAYTLQLLRNVQRAMRKHRMINKLRFLLYGTYLSGGDVAVIRSDDAGVVWL